MLKLKSLALKLLADKIVLLFPVIIRDRLMRPRHRARYSTWALYNRQPQRDGALSHYLRIIVCFGEMMTLYLTTRDPRH